MKKSKRRIMELRPAARMMLALALAISFVPMVPCVAVAQEEAAGASRVPIEQLLAAGDYVEGEAVAVVRSSGEVDAAAQATEIAEVDADAVEMAVEGVQASMEATEAAEAANAADAADALAGVAALRVQSQLAESYTVQLIADHSRTTEQILRELYEDPDVISAEPNYVTTATAAFGGEAAQANDAAASATDSSQGQVALMAASPDQLAGGLTAQADSATNPGDLTEYQWGMDESVATYKTPLSPEATYSMNVPGWAEGRTDEGAEPNASGTVCIMDTGVDYNHPDLKDVYYTFTEEQQAKYGCGKYGYNASGDELGERVPHTVGEHGTHVAGIVAAQWNGYGVSGVANGIKIFSVNVFGGNGNQMTLASVVKGFQFLADVSAEVNLKAVNCSWGIKQVDFAMTVVINNLGKKGVNTVIAAGNSHDNLDEVIDVANFADNPYVVTVDAAMPNGKMTDFSSYGQMATDVFAPGAQIMSTISQEVTIGSAGAVDSLSDWTRFYPEATAPENLDAGIERFSGATSPVRFFTANPAIAGSGAEELKATIKTGDGFGYDDSSSAAVNIGESIVKPIKQGGRVVAYGGDVYVAVPVSSAADAKWLGMTCAMSDAFKPSSTLAALTFSGKDGKPVEVGESYDSALKKGHVSGARFNFYWCQWTSVSYNVDGFKASANEAHEIIARGDQEEIARNGLAGLSDPGQIGDPYAWKDGEKEYLVAKVSLAGQNPAAKDTELFVDNVAIGKAGAFTGAFVNMPGTSMAAPAVAGCLAVIAKDEPTNATLSDEALELKARERAAKLLATVEYDGGLATLCRTGGRVNFKANPGFSKKAPLIYWASSAYGVLTVEGCFFGDAKGALEVDGKELSATEWSDGSITATLPAGLASGSHLVKVTNGDGAISRVLFSHTSTDANAGGASLYENELRLPVESPTFQNQERLWGPMVACDGSLYVMGATAATHMPLGLWRYDTATATWSSCSLPKGYVYDDPDFKQQQSYTENKLVACNGSLYLFGSYFKDAEIDEDGERVFNSDRSAIWRYDTKSGNWAETGFKAPDGGSMCALGDDLLFVGGGFFGIKVKDAPIDTFNEDSSCRIEYVKLDLGTGAYTAIKGDAFCVGEDMNIEVPKLVSTGQCVYYYGVVTNENTNEHRTQLKRLAYDEKKNSFSTTDLSAAFEAVAPELKTSSEMEAIKAHFAFAALPDGVAIVGSKVAGEDTHVIYDDATKAVPLNRTSCYHAAFDPIAGYCDGKLYASGWNATEAGVLYFRSTALAHEWNVTYSWSADGSSCTATRTCRAHGAAHSQTEKGKVTKATVKAPTYTAKGERICVATFANKGFFAQVKHVSIADLPGGAVGKAYKVGGNTYKVTSNTASTVTLTKAKAAATVKVPKTVKIDKKAYKVTAIGASAFKAAKGKVKTVSVGANVATIGKKAFASCAKLKKVTGGKAVTSIGASAFSGCKVLATCAPASSKALKKIGASAFKGCKKLKTLTVKSAALTKKGVKGSLKGSKVATVKVKVDTSAINKAYAKKYAKFFTKANAGKKAAVK